MTLTMPSLPPPRLSTIPCCPNCGHDLSLTISPPRDLDEQARALRDARAKIGDLETQIRLLNAKATAAVDKWADYEDELNKLRRQLVANSNNSNNNNNNERPMSPTAGISSYAAAATNRISAYLSKRSSPTPTNNNLKAQPSPGLQSGFGASRLTPSSTNSSSSSSSYASPSSPGHQPRYSTASSAATTPNKSLSMTLSSGDTISYTPGAGGPPPSADDLLDALTNEQRLRLAAEGRLNDTSQEVEELSVTLFEQANEMVAHERKVRARLEERVGELERREEDKKRRLERLEASLTRIERVRGLLAEKGKAG